MPGPRPGVLNKCQRSTSACSDAVPATRRINSKDVTRACWEWTTASTVWTPTPGPIAARRVWASVLASDPEAASTRTRSSHPRCAPHGALTSNAKPAGRSTTRWPTGTQQFCTEGTCWDTGHPPDTDFARTVTLLEAQREAGKYLDVNALRVFKGFDNRCDKKLFGLVNCCNRGGTGASGLFK